MRNLNSLAVLLGMLILFPVLNPKGSRAATQNATPFVMHMNKTQRGYTYKVSPKPKGYKPDDNLLRILDLIEGERGPNSPVIVLVEPHVSFTEIWDFDGVAGKAQHKNVHYFVFNPESKFMAELKCGAYRSVFDKPASELAQEPNCSPE